MHTIEWMRERRDSLYEWNMLRKNEMWNEINFFKKQKKRRHKSPYVHCACIRKLKIINRKIKEIAIKTEMDVPLSKISFLCSMSWHLFIFYAIYRWIESKMKNWKIHILHANTYTAHFKCFHFHFNIRNSD